MNPGQNTSWHFRALIAFLLLSFLPSHLWADDFSPALLQITERQGGWVDVLWKKPVKRNRAVVSIMPVLPGFLAPVGSPVVRQTPVAWVEQSTYRSGGEPLTGATLRIDGLDAVPNDVLIRIELKDGSQFSTILRSGNTSYLIPEQAGKLQVAGDYWLMGTSQVAVS